MSAGSRLWRHSLRQASAWLPVLMMLLFALGTWWLVRSTPRPPGEAPPAPPEQADYTMRDFSVRTFDPAGRLTAHISGEHGRHQPQDDTLHVQQPRITTLDAQGQPTVARADRAVTKGDGSEAELFGNVRVERAAFTPPNGKPQPALHYSGEYLHAFVEQERVVSDRPTQLIRGRDVFSGNRFEYDKRQGQLTLSGRVRGVVHPQNGG